MGPALAGGQRHGTGTRGKSRRRHRARGGTAIFVRTDVTDEAQVKALVETVVDRFGGLHVAFNNTSILGLIGLPGSSLYIASKHAVIGLTRAAALEYARRGIRVNAVAPGAVETDMIDTLTQGGNQAIVEGAVRSHPIGRMARPREIADAVVWLASEQASFVTGVTLPVDGGFTAQ